MSPAPGFPVPPPPMVWSPRPMPRGGGGSGPSLPFLPLLLLLLLLLLRTPRAPPTTTTNAAATTDCCCCCCCCCCCGYCCCYYCDYYYILLYTMSIFTSTSTSTSTFKPNYVCTYACPHHRPQGGEDTLEGGGRGGPVKPGSYMVFYHLTFSRMRSEGSRFIWGSGGEAVFAESCVYVRNRPRTVATVCVTAVRLSTVASASGVVLKACQVDSLSRQLYRCLQRSCQCD